MESHAIPALPVLTRKCSIENERVLPLRLSARYYDSDGGVVTVSDESPETDVNESASGEMYAMCIQVPICGHGTNMRKNKDSEAQIYVCEPVYAHMNLPTIMGVAKKLLSNNVRWIYKYNNISASPTTPPNPYLLASASDYTRFGPLTVYTNIAVIEAANHSSDSNFWRSLYPPMELIECHYGFWGLCYDNNVLSTGSSAGSDDSPDIKNRHPNPYHRGFIDVVFTPQSKGAGRVRMLAHGVTIRVRTARTIELALKIMSVVKFGFGSGSGDWLFRWMGFTSMVTREDVQAMMDVWKTMNEMNMPTMHVFEQGRRITMSTATGTLIRPVRMGVNDRKLVGEGPFVDSMCVYHSDTMRFINKTFPDPTVEPEQFVCTLARCVDHNMFTMEPRANLGIQMLIQSLNIFPTKGDATMVSLGESEPLIKTDVLDAIMNASTAEARVVFPGKNVVTAFVNRSLNTEDAFSIAEDFATMGSFAWMGYIDYPIPMGARVEPGMVLFDQHWWKPALPGMVTKVFMNKHGGWNAKVYIYVKELMNGDKLATPYGLKFTCGEMIPRHEMVTLIDTETGEKFKPNLLISTKNLNRGLGGQIRHMAASTSLFESISDFRSKKPPKGKTVYTRIDELKTEPKLRSAYVTMNGEKIEFEDSDGKMRTVKCNYGITRVLQLRHMPVLKQHYPSAAVQSIMIPRGRYRSGTPRLGETDLLAMMMQHLVVCSSEAVISSDKSVVTVCSACCVLPFFCGCPFPKPGLTTVGIRYSAVKMNTFATIAMLNDPSTKAMTLKYETST